MEYRKYYRFVLFAIALLLFNPLFAQYFTQYGKSDTITIKSNIFDTQRQVVITRPLKNGNDSVKNIIIYFDADDPNINGTVLQSADNLLSNQEIPKSYLVGIIQQDRDKEFLEKDKLLDFLTEELIPDIFGNERYTSKSTLIGHSFGGYFATYAFLKKNEIFSFCIAISPAYWPNNHDIFNYISEINLDSLSGNFYMAIGDKRWDDISIRKYVSKMLNILEESKTKIRYSFQNLSGFSHNATPTVGFGLGLSYVYDEWEWENILSEQNRRLKSFPDFWGHLEIKGDALYHMNRLGEAKSFFEKAFNSVSLDKNLSKEEVRSISERIKKKIKETQ